MNEDQELEQLRAAARPCRFEADEPMVQRVRTRVAQRVAQSPSIWDLLVVWFRPVAATLAVLIALLAFVLTLQTAEPSNDLLASVSPLPAAEELYRDE